MINPFKEVNWNPDLKQKKRFAKSLMIGFPFLGLVFLVAGKMTGRGGDLKTSLMIAGAGFGLGLLLLLLPSIAKPFYVVWYLISCCIGIVVGNLMLALVYYVLVTGLGLARRVLGRSEIRGCANPKASTYWEDAEQVRNPERYYNQF